MGRLSAAWRAFRRWPTPAQAAAWVALIGLYTAAAVAIVDVTRDPAAAPAPPPLAAAPPPPPPATRSPLERQIRAIVDGTSPLHQEMGDVERFVIPKTRRVRCPGSRCEVVYSLDVPGRGRILEQQAVMLRRIFGETDLKEIVLDVIRGQPTGPGATTPPAGEEIVAGSRLLTTTCDRSRGPDIDWSRAGPAEVIQKLCTVRGADQGAIHGLGRN